MSRTENAVQRAMATINQAVEDAPAFEAAHTGSNGIEHYAPRTHPSINALAHPSTRLVKAINGWTDARRALAMAEASFHLAQMELIRAEDAERNEISLAQNNRI